MTVSSLTSASLAPPLVLFCPAVTSRAWAAARERGTFAVNVLGHQHGELAVRFAGPRDRFAGLRTLPMDGIPVLADALTALVCDIHDEHPGRRPHHRPRPGPRRACAPRRHRPGHRVAAGDGYAISAPTPPGLVPCG